MSDSAGGSAEESTPLLYHCHHGDKPPVPIIRARVVSTLVTVFCLSANSARDTLLAQYLFSRLATDEGYSNTTHTNVCIRNNSDPEVKKADDIQAQATELLMYYGLIQSIPAFFSCLFVGSYSDFLGRRPLLLIPVFSNMVKTVIIALIIRFDLDLRFMYLAYGIDGIAGSSFSFIMAIFALTADISVSVESRTFWIYFVAVAEATMSAVATISNGYIIEYLGFFYASLLLICMTLLSFIIPLFFLPETFHQRPPHLRLNPLVHLRRIFGFYFFDGSMQKRATYILLLSMHFFGVACLTSISSLDALYQLHEPFCWDSDKIGMYQGVRTAGGFILGAFWLKGWQRCVAPGKIGMVGTLFQAASYSFEALITSSWQFFLVPLINVPGASVVPVIRTLLSLLTDPDRQGAIFSSVAVIETICSLCAGTVWNKIYGATVNAMPGLVYLVIAGCSLLIFTLFIIYHCVREQAQPQEPDVCIEEPTIQKT